jgi:hypothetical protein
MTNEPDNSPPPPTHTHTEDRHIGGNHTLRLAAISAGEESDLQQSALELLKNLETLQQGKEERY